jgi:hypothetical protein
MCFEISIGFRPVIEEIVNEICATKHVPVHFDFERGC